MIVRREQPADVPTVRAVVTAAFATAPDQVPVETWLLDRLRADEGWLPRLALVAVDPAQQVIGQVVCTRAHVGETPALGLGPIAVRPDWQRQGVGNALMHHVLGAAEALDETVVALLGDPAYYGRYGFRPASELGIEPPEAAWGPYFQALPLATRQPVRGRFAYAKPFQEL